MSTTTFEFKPATKAQSKARIALSGGSGSGKTFSALAIAQGLGQSIGVIDTEKESASKYESCFPPFFTLPMDSFHPLDLVKALAAAAGAGIEVVIIDSLTHFWSGTDGLLAQVDKLARAKPSNNSFGAWKDANPIEADMLAAILTYPGHVIVTMRSKTQYVVEPDATGKQAPRKIGLAPVQRDGIEYEFDLVGELDQDNILTLSKSRAVGVIANREVIIQPDIEFGRKILDWLMDGVPLPSARDYLAQLAAATELEQVRAIYKEVVARKMAAAPCRLSEDGAPLSLLDLVIARAQELTPPPAAPPVASTVDDHRRLDDVMVRKGLADNTAKRRFLEQHLRRPVTGYAGLTVAEVDGALLALEQLPDPAARAPRAKPAPARTAPASVGQPKGAQGTTEPPMATPALLKIVNTALSRDGMARKADRLAYCAKVVDRPLTSMNDLTFGEAHKVLDHVEDDRRAALDDQEPDDSPEQFFEDLKAMMMRATSVDAIDASYRQAAAAAAAGALTEELLAELGDVGNRCAAVMTGSHSSELAGAAA